MRTAFTAAFLSLALTGAMVAEAQAAGVRLSSSSQRINVDAMEVKGAVCVDASAQVATPNLALRVLNRRGEVVGALPVDLYTSPQAQDGCAYYKMDVQIQLSEAAQICLLTEGEDVETAKLCAARLTN